jgi:hypothetical protein
MESEQKGTQKDGPGIYVSSLVSARTREALVTMSMTDAGGNTAKCQLGVGEAMAHVYNVLRTITSAETDAFLLSFLTDDGELGLDDAAAGAVLVRFRAWRDKCEALPAELRQYQVREHGQGGGGASAPTPERS